jgi:hypothetical protein
VKDVELIGFSADLSKATSRILAADPVVKLDGELFVAQDGGFEPRKTLLPLRGTLNPTIHRLRNESSTGVQQGDVVHLASTALLDDLGSLGVVSNWVPSIREDWTHDAAAGVYYFVAPRNAFADKLQVLSEDVADVLHKVTRGAQSKESERLLEMYSGIAPVEDAIYLAHLSFYFMQTGRLPDSDLVIERGMIFGTAASADIIRLRGGLVRRYSSSPQPLHSPRPDLLDEYFIEELMDFDEESMEEMHLFRRSVLMRTAYIAEIGSLRGLQESLNYLVPLDLSNDLLPGDIQNRRTMNR